MKVHLDAGNGLDLPPTQDVIVANEGLYRDFLQKLQKQMSNVYNNPVLVSDRQTG